MTNPTRAIACALALDIWAEEFRERWKSRGVNFGATRIGLHAGSALVGNFGGGRSRSWFLVVSGKKSDTISSYKIDEASGGLTLIGKYPAGKDANWVEIVSFD
ncbi:beta-propeller fold lactonase family protein [Bradyrhizobium sp.]|uniref:beta-propeller fold lactonase family protein n=1 Tax=Bradyrhizobium sp. TaxID=376 RepID=UPI003C4C93F3